MSLSSCDVKCDANTHAVAKTARLFKVLVDEIIKNSQRNLNGVCGSFALRLQYLLKQLRRPLPRALDNGIKRSI